MGATRRAFLAAAAASVLSADQEKGKNFPSEWQRYADPATEFEVLRLTDPVHSSYLTAYYNRSLAHRGSFLLFSSDRTGSKQAVRMDLKTGECRQLTQVDDLDSGSLTLSPDERSFYCFDGPALRLQGLNGQRDREMYRIAEGWKRSAGASVTADGLSAIFGETRDQGSRLRLIGLLKPGSATVTETPFPPEHPVPRPRRAQILYRQGDEALWLVNFDGAQNRRLRTALDGRIGTAFWSASGRTILYLHIPNDATKLIAIREHTPDENLDKLVATTSQFAHFNSNADSSVFVGASRNRTSPHILILLRVARRELTICEHRSSDPYSVAPLFSHDSQRVYFQSDRDGKPALYSVEVKRFVEKTEEP